MCNHHEGEWLASEVVQNSEHDNGSDEPEWMDLAPRYHAHERLCSRSDLRLGDSHGIQAISVYDVDATATVKDDSIKTSAKYKGIHDERVWDINHWT
jgi:hypothetical protein